MTDDPVALHDGRVFDGDPISDIRATRTIRTVWCAGRDVDRPSQPTPPFSPHVAGGPS